MSASVDETEAAAKAKKSSLLAKSVCVAILGIGCIWAVPGDDAKVASVKPIFTYGSQQQMTAAKPIFGTG